MSSIYTALKVHPKKDYAQPVNQKNQGKLFGLKGQKVHKVFAKAWTPANIEGVVGAILLGIGLLCLTGVIPGGSGLGMALVGAGGAMFADAFTAHCIHIVKMLLKDNEEKRNLVVKDDGKGVNLEESEEETRPRTLDDSTPKASLRAAPGKANGTGWMQLFTDAAKSVSEGMRGLVGTLNPSGGDSKKVSVQTQSNQTSGLQNATGRESEPKRTRRVAPGIRPQVDHFEGRPTD